MILKFELSSGINEVDSEKPLDISIPLIFNGEQPNIYNIKKASSKACETADFIGDTRRGGSCNFEEYRLVPHCNGTHTECVGHISFERIPVNETLKDVFIPSTLITVQPEKANETEDTYSPLKNENDFFITKKNLESMLSRVDNDFLKGLVIRTMPNDDSKKSRNYMENLPPFFSHEAMKYIKQAGVKHLLIDIPSVDRTFDEGKLSAHHIFWNVEQGSHKVDCGKHSLNTITEMIYVPNEIKDGIYLLNIQIASLKSDASPSRPVLFGIKN